MARVLYGLINCFEDKVADLEIVVLHSFVEVLRYFLLVSCHSKIRLVSLFLDQIELFSEGFFVSLFILVCHSVGW